MLFPIKQDRSSLNFSRSLWLVSLSHETGFLFWFERNVLSVFIHDSLISPASHEITHENDYTLYVVISIAVRRIVCSAYTIHHLCYVGWIIFTFCLKNKQNCSKWCAHVQELIVTSMPCIQSLLEFNIPYAKSRIHYSLQFKCLHNGLGSFC